MVNNCRRQIHDNTQKVMMTALVDLNTQINSTNDSKDSDDAEESDAMMTLDLSVV